uniref:SWIM-type domain-containing protein n=1 Tax=Glycine max TaxID=3847 RepID=A0A0R0GDX6_SOYBN
MESSDNFCSSVNGDRDDDVTKVYDDDEANEEDVDHNRMGDSDDQDDVGLEHEEEADSEVDNDDYRDYDDLWIPSFFKEECITMDTIVDIRQFDMGKMTIEDHNHLLLDLKLSSLLPAHRKMSATDIIQIENYRKVGIRPPHMYTTFANHCGGYDKVGFIRKDIYNQKVRMRKQHTSDASGALKYLHNLRKKDPVMYVSYTADEGSRLQWLFWCDAESQLLYEVFGDVLIFDATYKKNKYLFPFVVFSGVNHHNQTIVFGTAIMTDETEETYVWFLEKFLEAMKGKTPCSIITDGDLAIRNAITRVMPGVFHRLCAWHLLSNALSHVRDKQVLKWLKKLMLGDFEVIEFEEKWTEMVATFQLEDNSWIAELYEKRMKWSPAHLRGNFFAGIRTTSRCEAFHAHVAKYVHSRTNLTDFVEQFQRCLTYFRYRVVVADYFSTYENELTKEMFILFQSYVSWTIKLRVVDCIEMVMFLVYTIVKYCSGSVWRVSYCPFTVHFSCCCMRMQSIGLPCDHILAVLVCLNFTELPSSLVLNRWSKYATKVSREVCEATYCDQEAYDKMLHFLSNELRRRKSKKNSQPCFDENDNQHGDNYDGILDPVVVRTKGCGQVGIDESGK